MLLLLYFWLFNSSKVYKDGVMKIARIILSEHPKDEDLNKFLDGHREAVANGFLSIANFSVAVQTGPTSQLTFTVYESEEAALSNLEARAVWFEERKHLVSDTFYHEGNIRTILQGGGGVFPSEPIISETFSENRKIDHLSKEISELKSEIAELKLMIHSLSEI